jgi:hypothetical protein
MFQVFGQKIGGFTERLPGHYPAIRQMLGNAGCQARLFSYHKNCCCGSHPKKIPKPMRFLALAANRAVNNSSYTYHHWRISKMTIHTL